MYYLAFSVCSSLENFISIMMSLTSILSVLPFLQLRVLHVYRFVGHLNLNTVFFFMEFKKFGSVGSLLWHTGFHCGAQILWLWHTSSVVVVHEPSNYDTWA